MVLLEKMVARAPSPPPPTDFIKLNFDGASKGNPRSASFGAVLRNEEGKILYYAAGYLGFNTNNAADLWSLLKGVKLAKKHDLHKLIMEGDS